MENITLEYVENKSNEHAAIEEKIKVKKPRKPRVVKPIEFRDPALAEAIRLATPKLIDQARVIERIRLDVESLERFLRKSGFQNYAELQFDQDQYIMWAKPISAGWRLFVKYSEGDTRLLLAADDSVLTQAAKYLPELVQIISTAATISN